MRYIPLYLSSSICQAWTPEGLLCSEPLTNPQGPRLCGFHMYLHEEKEQT
jgi:hypothetical protein